ncbi:MAG TPA: hypothetical protein VFX22_08490, partial [Candidatus Kapabacteria bacterium]|nr:hypothetical protein [Candidatus Kapabacteria bacterium]
TVPSPNWALHLDTSLTGSSHFQLLPVPDVSPDTSITIVFIAGIVPYRKPNNTASQNYSSFWLHLSDGRDTISPGNSGGGMSNTKNPEVLQIPLAAGTSTTITVTDSIGSNFGSNQRVFGNTTSFTAYAGGIYEIVSEGIKTDPHLLIMHVNANATNP